MNNHEPEAQPAPDAEALYAEYLRCRDQEDADFEDFVARNPRHADALRALHSLYMDTSGVQLPASGSASLGPVLQGLGGRTGKPPSPDDLMAGDTVESYRLCTVLGEGGFGVVYRAEQQAPVRRDVALKVLKPGMDSREVVARFEAERQALALMNHPCIAQVYNAGLTMKGRPYFAMEYVQGIPITGYCARHELSVRDRLTLFIRVCDAVQHAHLKAVIHRDLKPSNVLVTIQGSTPRPKIIDFGVAKATNQCLSEKTCFTELGQLIGTPAYMSPEQAEMSGLDVDTRTDIYSLGVLLYELVTGVLPFDPLTFTQASYVEIQRILREDDPPRPSTRVAAAPSGANAPHHPRGPAQRGQLRGDLDWIIMKAMAKDRTRRYSTASELAADIRRHLRHEPVLAGPPSLGYRLRKLVRRHPQAFAASILVVLLGTVLIGGLRLHRSVMYNSHVHALEGSLVARDLTQARQTLTLLQDRYPERAAVRTMANSVAALAAQLQLEKSHTQLEKAQRLWKEHTTLRATLSSLEEQWQRLRLTLPRAAPPWEREEEFKVYDRLVAVRNEADDLYSDALIQYQRAIETGAGVTDTPRTALAKVFRDVYHDAVASGARTFRPDFFRRRGAELAPPLFADRGGTVTLVTTPANTDVYCFRFKEFDRRLTPLPFDVSVAEGSEEERILTAPRVVIEQVLAPDGCPFRTGDWLKEFKTMPLTTWGSLAHALATCAVGETVAVRVHREGMDRVLEWTPYPGNADESQKDAGHMHDTYRQFGFTLHAYPLVYHEKARILRNPGSPSCTVSLPNGSYLFVARARGYVTTRLPLQVMDARSSLTLELLPTEDLPPGFVCIPIGAAHVGGDPEAFQSLPRTTQQLPTYLLQRCEVTFDEFLEFLNDPVNPVDANGYALPASDRVRQTNFRDRKIRLAPRGDSEAVPLIVFQDGQWQRAENPATGTPEIPDGRWPVVGITQFAACEYAHWYTVKKHAGSAWRFTLPTDLQWEKAARGADRRFFVWGDYPLWNYSHTYRGIQDRRKLPRMVGLSSADASVYGVRDLTGSVSEHALGQPCPGFSYQSIRGGSFYDSDEYYGRAATRNGLLPVGSATSTGFRLAAIRK